MSTLLFSTKPREYVALDVETATSSQRFICEVGIALITEGKIVEKHSWLVQPPHNRYDWYLCNIHGITPNDTTYSPPFPQVWRELVPYLKHRTIIAHNASFDRGALQNNLSYYRLPPLRNPFLCTVKMSRRTFPQCINHKLGTLCEMLSIPLAHHHRAGDDAQAAAHLFLRCMQHLQHDPEHRTRVLSESYLQPIDTQLTQA